MQRRARHLVFAILGVAIGLLGAMPLHARADNQVPFIASITAGTDTLTSTGFTNVSSGNATHLGAFTMSGVGTTVLFQPISPTQVRVGSHETYTLMAANGDEVYLTNDATALATYTSATTATIIGTGTWRITGGTGRFSGATGSGTTTVTLYVDFTKGTMGVATGTSTFTGTISSPGSLS